MWMTKVSINNPVFATMVMAALMVLGLFSYKRLAVDQLPDVSMPIAVISTPYPGASAEAVEQDVVRPIEQAVNTINGVKTIRSSSQIGFGWVVVEFQLNIDPRVAIQDVRDKVAEARRGFNRDVGEPTVSRASMDDDQPLVYLSMRSDSRSLRELSDLADQLVVKRLQGAPGVGNIVVSGDVGRELAVNLRPEKMAALGVGVNEVIAAIRAENQNISAGALVSDVTERVVRVSGKIRRAEDFARIIVARRGGAGGATTAITLGQVADVSDSQREETSFSTDSGKRAISIQIRKTRGANTIDMADGVKKQVTELKKSLPADIKLDITFDRSKFIKDGVDNVKTTILEGAVLTVLIVFFFLHSWRSTVITGLTLPISIFATFIVLYAMGFTINFMTLMAMSLSIGILIDDAIVVRENIVRHLAMGKSHMQAALEATNEIGLAVMATTFTIVAVFLPVAFMGGIIGKFFLQFGVTVVVAVMVSLFVSFTLDPMLSSIWHDPKSRWMEKQPIKWLLDRQESLMDGLHQRYDVWLRWSLIHRKTTLGIAALTFVGSFFLYPFIGSEFVPEEDDNWTSVQIQTPIGSSLAYTSTKAEQVETALRDFPEIKRISKTVNKNNAWFELQLVDKEARKLSQKQLDDMIRKRLNRIAGLEINIGFNPPIQVYVMGPDIKELDRISQEVMNKMKAIKGIVDVDSSFKPTNPSLDVVVNRELASDLGVSMNEIGITARALIAGEPVGQWEGPDGENHQVMVRLPRSERTSISDLDKIFVRANGTNADGTARMVPLRQVADFQPSVSERRIDRRNLQRQIRIMAGVTSGVSVGDAAQEVKKITDATALPPGYRFQLGGSSQDMQESLGFAAAALALGVIFIYFILASQFGSFLQPIAIMASLPLSLIGVFLALMLFGSTLNLFSVIGFIMLMGLVTKNAILLVDFTNQGIREGKDRIEAILAAGQVRLRPILMTTTAMIFGMLPLALAFGAGSEQQSPMAHAVIGGIITSTIMTLVVVPVLFTYMDALGHRASRWLLRKPPTTVVPAEATSVAKPQLGAGGSIKPVLQERNSDQ
ncbi:MAG: efflux RND transporter permease subunit [Burkholderiales bacterium]|jgi:HAE1 family hydrophobic/amphiphilic exporter-1|nr:efflux RND transporter permease subunit [Rhodocyclaceae bacterium]MCA3021521.1 efflux RND transporter permease subunit [Rhodocyclaceae bacterium]MCA3054068.1 efflux RND transporter permease subunit [Rhodocyclaceae bacterium]MCA3057085.1 efflux RND transporter permease subunit [Rhodocyclaceae bacterium]MCE2722678.1 efflux RND transporter permease subunit [Betaproteobacteria bacterium]